MAVTYPFDKAAPIQKMPKDMTDKTTPSNPDQKAPMTRGNAMRHGGHILLESLINLGATQGFGVPGESYLAALDAMYDSGFDFTLCRQEGGAAFMAAAYGKLTGRPGICFVTRGPGATNAAIGVHSAHQDSSPMILFVGQVGTNYLDREAFQEVDYRRVFGGLAKWVTQIDDIDRLPELVARAWSVALSGRQGPVVVALPENMLSAQSDVPACQPGALPQPAPASNDITAIFEALAKANRPVIIAGGGNWDEKGRADLQKFAEKMALPVAASFRCHDVIDNHSLSYCGDAGVGMHPSLSAILQEADVIFAINIRFGEMVTKEWSLFDVPYMKAALLHAHISSDEIGKIYQPDVAIQACPNLLMAELCDKLDDHKGAQQNPHEAWQDHCRNAWLDAIQPPPQNTDVDMAEIITTLDQIVADDAIITHGAGNFAIWPDKFMHFGKRRLLAPQSGAMGYGLPAAIAAGKAAPDKQIICFAGDGDIQMTLSELGTVMQQGLRLVILIFNNGSYGTIRMHQERHYPERVSGTSLANPDFKALASAYGFACDVIADTASFKPAFMKALAADRATILELKLDVEAISPHMTITKLRQG